jgi:hypothetical protein
VEGTVSECYPRGDMRTLDPQYGLRLPAVLCGFVAALALVLSSLVLSASAADSPEAHKRQSTPSVCGGPPAAPEQALHRVTATTPVAPVRIVHAGDLLPVPAQLAGARCDARPVDHPGFAASTSGIPLRVLFCTWLN